MCLRPLMTRQTYVYGSLGGRPEAKRHSHGIVSKVVFAQWVSLLENSSLFPISYFLLLKEVARQLPHLTADKVPT